MIVQRQSGQTKAECSMEAIRIAEDDVLLAKITPCFENGKLGIARDLQRRRLRSSEHWYDWPKFFPSISFTSCPSIRDAGAQIRPALWPKRVTNNLSKFRNYHYLLSPNKSALSPFSMKRLRGSRRRSPMPKRTSPTLASCSKAASMPFSRRRAKVGYTRHF